MKKYFRIVLGKNHSLADEAIKGNFVGVRFIPEIDFAEKLFTKIKNIRLCAVA